MCGGGEGVLLAQKFQSHRLPIPFKVQLFLLGGEGGGVHTTKNPKRDFTTHAHRGVYKNIPMKTFKSVFVAERVRVIHGSYVKGQTLLSHKL